jgi:hypothetical protein
MPSCRAAAADDPLAGPARLSKRLIWWFDAGLAIPEPGPAELVTAP